MENNEASGIEENSTTSLHWNSIAWTKEQLEFIENVPIGLHVTLGIVLSFISVLGILANGVVLFVFSRSVPVNPFKSLLYNVIDVARIKKPQLTIIKIVYVTGAGFLAILILYVCIS